MPVKPLPDGRGSALILNLSAQKPLAHARGSVSAERCDRNRAATVRERFQNDRDGSLVIIVQTHVHAPLVLHNPAVPGDAGTRRYPRELLPGMRRLDGLRLAVKSAKTVNIVKRLSLVLVARVHREHIEENAHDVSESHADRCAADQGDQRAQIHAAADRGRDGDAKETACEAGQ
jgi:hypothetical protein